MTPATPSASDDRDNFSGPTKDLLAKRSGYICAYPGCRRMTVAVSEDRKSGLTMTGVAAHITAAQAGGPRYDSLMSPEERSSERNGVWMCQTHGKAVDDNASKCTVEELRRWKAQHEQWIFERVMNGAEKLHHGTARLKIRGVGVFREEQELLLGRHNVLFGANEAGKTTLCEALAAFAGGQHWHRFNDRFSFSASSGAYIEAVHIGDGGRSAVRLSPQVMAPGGKRHSKPQRPHVHIEVNGSTAADWPRSLFRVLSFDDQLRRTHQKDPKDTFTKALRNLADALGTDESLVWDSLREELFASTAFGYRFRRVGWRKAEVLVPDGRTFFLPHTSLSFSEQQIAFLDIALRLASFRPRGEAILYVFDTSFFQRLDGKSKVHLFRKITALDDGLSQTLFCVNDAEDAEILKDVQPDNWINAQRLGRLTLHNFL